jgi:signal transduction histidine kinase/DNA-binding response OmpR family regulator/ligand-binding sensor domain-containing protein
VPGIAPCVSTNRSQIRTFSPGNRTNCAATGFFRHFNPNCLRIRLLFSCIEPNDRIFIGQLTMRTAVIKAIFFAGFLAAVGRAAHAQAPPLYESISIAQGLSQGMIFDLLQDREGFIWVATKNGLNRYDGYSFNVFANDPYNPASLSGNTIVELLEDSKGHIWAGTDNNGVNIYDKKKGVFYRLTHNNANPGSISSNSIKTIVEMTDGRFLVGTVNAGLNIISLGNEFFEKGAAAQITRLALPNNTQLYGMGSDGNARIWVGGMDGAVYQFNPGQNSFARLPDAKLYNSGHYNADGSLLANNNLFLANGLTVTPLFDTTRIPAGNLLLNPLGTPWDNIHREPYYYKLAPWQAGKSPDFTEALPVDTSRRIIYPFMIDRSGILWSGSLGYGLRKYHTVNNRFTTQASGNSLRLLVPVAANEIIWADFSYQWSTLKEGITAKGAFSKIPSVNEIDNFIVAKTNDYWIKSDNSGYHKYNPSTRLLQAYPAINPGQVFGNKQPFMEDSKGNIWLPGQEGAITLLNTATEKISQFSINTNKTKLLITHLYEDKQGSFWVGAETGMAKLSFTNGMAAAPVIKWFYNDNSTRNSLNYNHVSCFLDDPVAPDQYLWISTKGGGLNRLDKSNGTFIHLTAKNGLPDDVVYGLLADAAGNIWGSTNKGIFCMMASKDKQDSWSFRNFTKADGLQDDEFNTGAFAKLPDGQLAFGGVNGINIFNPKAILAANFTPNVFITSLSVNNQPVLPGDASGVLQKTIEQSGHITLTYQQDILTLDFAALDFTAPAQNKYRYQLVGIDKDWVESGTRRSATYLHLPAGQYTFKVQGSNSQGVWSDQTAELNITVLPPWWRTWWAYLAYIFAILLAIRLYLKFKVNKARLKAQLQYQQEEAKRVKELDSIKTQLYTNITHEFRTPLTVILGMARQVTANPDRHFTNGMDMIVRNGESLLNLVNELLDLSKLESGKMTLQLTHGDLISFLRYVVESFQSLAASQNKQFHFLSDVDELSVAFDGEKMRQIITNLLSNALKFTPEKGNVYVSLMQDTNIDEAIAQLIIKVKDTGIGIPENQIPYIFDRFYQLDNSATRKAEGTGIGLALTKELVKLLGGSITVKSPPVGATKGTEFTVSLPFTLVPRSEAPSAAATSALREPAHTIISKQSAAVAPDTNNNTDTPLILLVEDNADVVAYTASCLPDYKLSVGRDGREGFEIATDIVPDLIITDVMMPFVDGFEMCRQLRADERTSHIPIIMLTAKADMQSKLEGIEQGADVYLEKPFNREELLLRIRKLLETRQQLQQYYMKLAGMGVSAGAEAAATAALPPEAATENEFVIKVRTVIEAHLEDYHFSVEQLCKKIFMSHSQLHRKLHALVGCSPNKFIRMVRLAKAQQLLRSSDESIAAIALASGFNDPGYFARVFKQEFGCTPVEWKGRVG